MTFGPAYSLKPGDALEDLNMGGGSILSLKVTGAESHGLVTVLESTVHSGGPPLHVHDAEDEVIIVLDGELDYRVGDERGTSGYKSPNWPGWTTCSELAGTEVH